MKHIRQFISFIFIFCFTTQSFAEPLQGQPSKNHPSIKKLLANESPEDRAMYGRMVSVLILQDAKYQIESYLKKQDKKSLSELLNSVTPEERPDIKKDLDQIQEKLKFEVQGPILNIVSAEGTTEFKIEDPFEGRIRINGQLLLITPETSYHVIKNRLDEIAKSANHKTPLLFDAVFPKAHAAAAVAKLAIRGWKVISGLLAKKIQKEPETYGQLIANKLLVKGPWKAVEVVGIGGVAGVVFGCSAFGTAVGGNNCWTPEGRKGILCTITMKENCTSKLEDLESEIVDAKKKPETVVPFFLPEQCVPNEKNTGLVRQAKVVSIKLSALRSALIQKKEIKDLHPVSTADLHMEYQGNPKDPATTKLKTITEDVRDEKQNVVAKRIWKFEGDKKFTIAHYSAEQLKQLTKTPAQYITPQKIDCVANSSSKECKNIYNALFDTLREEKDCPVENAASVIKGIQSETAATPAKAGSVK